jgi:hypothetical protein
MPLFVKVQGLGFLPERLGGRLGLVDGTGPAKGLPAVSFSVPLNMIRRGTGCETSSGLLVLAIESVCCAHKPTADTATTQAARTRFRLMVHLDLSI